MRFPIGNIYPAIRSVCKFSSAIYYESSPKREIPKATAQFTLLLPMKYFSHTITFEKIELRSWMTFCCCSMCSTHFRRDTHVVANNVRLYPRRPRCVKVIAYPLFAGSLFRPGRFNPIVVVLAGGNNPDVGRFAKPPFDAVASSD
jgi:hypothetical protein